MASLKYINTFCIMVYLFGKIMIRPNYIIVAVGVNTHINLVDIVRFINNFNSAAEYQKYATHKIIILQV